MEKKKEKKLEHEILQVEAILPNPDNPRVVDVKSESFSELVKSIEKIGVLVPIHVLEQKKKGGKYQLLAGDRRLKASLKAKLKSIPVLIHHGLTPDEAFEITFVENFAREDLTPIEQGRAVTTLLKKFKNDAKAVAGKLGQTERWVKTRSLIDDKLIKKWKALSAGAGWTGAHLAIIARCPEMLQLELYEHFDDPDLSAPTIDRLNRVLSDYQRLITKAPWQLDEKMEIGLENGKTKKIACSECKNRTGFQPELWETDLSPETLKKNDKCLDKNCWQQKAFLYLKNLRVTLKAKHPDLICVTDRHYVPSAIQKNFGTVLDSYDFDKTIQQKNGAVPALVVDGDNAGKLIYVALRSRGSRTVKKEKAKGKATPLKARRVLHNSKRWFATLKKLSDKIEKSKVADIQHKDKSLVLLSLTCFFGAHYDSEYMKGGVWKETRRYKGHKTLWSSFHKTMKTKATAKILDQLWPDIASVLISNIAYNGPITQVPEQKINDAKQIAKLLGIDIGAMFAEQVKEIPEPKSWAKLNEDGTPKTAKPKKAKAKKAVKKTAKKKTAKKAKAKKAKAKKTVKKAKARKAKVKK